MRSFSIGFAEDDYDEAAHAKAVACHLGTEHSELYVMPEEARGVILSLPDIYDEPFDPAPIRARWQDHLSGKRNWQYALWGVLMFNAWLQHETG